MVFSSLTFLFGFLPVCLILIFIFRKKTEIQNALLVLASIVFYTWGEPEYIWLFLITIFINWIMMYLAGQVLHESKKKLIGIFTIFIDLLFLVWFKYARWLGNGFGISIGGTALPIGISFYTFQAISYVADITLLNKYKAEKNPINVALYISFFPQLIAGPIVRYEDIREQILKREISFDLLEKGSFRFLLGFCKKILFADTIAVIAEKAFSSGEELSFSFAWLGAIAYTLQIFIDFSAYSDMAIGLGAIFGFRLPENFNSPYKAKNIRDFWRRWHITLSIWFRDYVYIPLGGNRRGIYRTIINIFIVWLLTGIWHGANFTFLLWGVIYGICVLAEKILNVEKVLQKMGKPVQFCYRLFTLLVIMLLWVIFRSQNIHHAIHYMMKMVRFSLNGIDETIWFFSELKWSFIGCLILCVVSSSEMMKRRLYVWPILLMLFIVSIVYLVKGSFSPFLYFNF